MTRLEQAIHDVLAYRFPGQREDISAKLMDAGFQVNGHSHIGDFGYTSITKTADYYAGALFSLDTIMSAGDIHYCVANMLPDFVILEGTGDVAFGIAILGSNLYDKRCVPLVANSLYEFVDAGKLEEACAFLTHIPKGWYLLSYIRKRSYKHSPTSNDLPPMHTWKICPICSEYMVPKRESYHKSQEHPHEIEKQSYTIDTAIAKLIQKALNGVTDRSHWNNDKILIITEPTIVVQCDSKLIKQLVKSDRSVNGILPMTWYGQNVHLPYTKELALVLRTCMDAKNRKLIKKYMEREEDRYYETLLVALGVT